MCMINLIRLVIDFKAHTYSIFPITLTTFSYFYASGAIGIVTLTLS